MNRATVITALATCAFALPGSGHAESSREKPVLDAFQSVFDAQLASDFPRLASLLHPDSLRLFRTGLSARFDQLLRYFPVEKVAAISGLPGHPKDIPWQDREVFVAACNTEKERHPEFVGNPRSLPLLKVHGTIFEGETTAYVLFSFPNSIHTERTELDYVQPVVFAFRREGDQWLLFTSILGSRIMEDWWRDISQAGLRELDRPRFESDCAKLRAGSGSVTVVLTENPPSILRRSSDEVLRGIRAGLYRRHVQWLRTSRFSR